MKLKLLSLFLLVTVAFASSATAQSTWQEAAQHPSFGVERAFSFEIDGIVYVGGGRLASGFNLEEIWAYDITTGDWIPKSNFPGTPRRNAFAFAANGYGYVGAGHDLDVAIGDFWRYDPATDTWTQLDDFPGGVRSHAVGISGDNKGYVSLGRTSDTDGYYNDFWEFDAATETWTELANFPSDGRWRAYGFFIDGKVYVGGGRLRPNDAFQDLYAYDLTTGTWEEKTAAPTPRTLGAFSFVIQNKGFLIEGATQTSGTLDYYGQGVFMYEPTTDTWIADDVAFIGEGRVLGVSEVVGNQAILGTGRNYVNGMYYNDMYIFTPDLPTAIEEKETANFNIYPNPIAGSQLFVQGDFLNESETNCRIYDVNGSLVLFVTKNATGQNTISLDIKKLPKGIYQLEIINNERVNTQKFVKM